MLVVKEHDKIIKCKKKRILNLSYKQGFLFKKFKESDRFLEMLKDIGISKSIIYFKLKARKKVRKVKKSQKIFVVVNLYEKLYEID